MTVKIPNCPETKIKIAVAAECEATAFLPQIIKPCRIESLSPSMMYHSDLQLCHLKDNYYLSCPEGYEYYREKLSPFGLKVICGKSFVGSTYPKDSAYNIARIGNLAFHNTGLTDDAAKNFFKENGIKLCHTNQGYTKCSVAVTGINSCITSDRGVYKALLKEGVDALLIEPGFISLPGFSTGFFGGCAALIAPYTLFVTGSLKKHRDCDKIKNFLKIRGIEIFEAGDDPPLDIGSVICIA